MDEQKNYSKGYGKRPLWQWIAIYAVVGAIVYGLVYYFVFYNKGSQPQTYGQPQTTRSSGY